MVLVIELDISSYKELKSLCKFRGLLISFNLYRNIEIKYIYGNNEIKYRKNYEDE